jgi:hypothetical protein
VAAKTWTNFIREVHPGLLQGKDRSPGIGPCTDRKPSHFACQQNVATGVEGADLVEYESMKAMHKLKQKQGGEYEGDSDDDDVIENGKKLAMTMKILAPDEEEVEEVDEEEAMKKLLTCCLWDGKTPATIDLSKMSTEERNGLNKKSPRRVCLAIVGLCKDAQARRT